ncbi:acyl-CoA dehydrogenase family protein [Caulobacter sp. KR2-114]|uniref:acyl-CoA dehydrogenase family protein n=1 Tax=Caulobacter sp. KR2-114 TaxID=3400912 RepID=UPI003C0D7A98
MADFGATEPTELAAFRAEAREWLEANVPQSVRNAPEMTMEQMEGGGKPTADAELWRQRIGAKGWGVPTWPKQYGGGGLSAAEARVLAQEMARIGARNPIVGMGPGMFGSTLLEYGTEEQKQRHLPPIVRGELRWCQGFSEPGAGSDLASLQTKAEDKGDHWLINGQKIWTSGAQYADWCFCLCRTDNTKKHEGISFILIPMHQPGVEARPIKMISGASGQCETFFTDAKASKDDLVGQLNGGWAIAKRLLQHERNGMGNRSEGGPRQAENLGDIAKRYVGVDDTGRLADADLRGRITLQKMDEQALKLTVRRAAAEAKGNANVSTATSIMKNVSMKSAQDRSELLVEIYGAQGLGWEGDAFKPEELSEVRGWLAGKAFSIFGGTHEVQNNIISKRILGLPDPTSGASK